MCRRVSAGVLGWVFLSVVGAVADEQSWDIRGEYVSLKEGDAGVVVLRTAGGLLEVPLAALGESSRAAIGKLGRPVRPGVAETGGLPTGTTQDLVACVTAADASDVCSLALADPGVEKSCREALESQRAAFEVRAMRGEVRQKDVWVAAEVAREAARKAAVHLDRAAEMMRVGNGKLVEEELRQASQSDPSSGRADFVTGLAFMLRGRPDYDAAGSSFEEVVRREPGNGPAWNNLAVCNAQMRQYDKAVDAFRIAAEMLADSQAVTANLAILIRLAADRRSRISPKELDGITTLYHEVTKDRAMPAGPAASGPVVLAPEGGPIAAGGGVDLAAITAADTVPLPVAELVGFVVAPDTVACVVPGEVDAVGDSLLVESGDGKSLPAKRVAASPDGAVVLLKCEGLGITPMPLADGLPALAQQVTIVSPAVQPMKVGQPAAGTAITATVLAVPSATAERPRLVVDIRAEGSREAGGPGTSILDATGRLVGFGARQPIARQTAGSKRLAVPVDVIRRLLKQPEAPGAPEIGQAVIGGPAAGDAVARVQAAVVRVRNGQAVGSAP